MTSRVSDCVAISDFGGCTWTGVRVQSIEINFIAVFPARKRRRILVPVFAAGVFRETVAGRWEPAPCALRRNVRPGSG